MLWFDEVWPEGMTEWLKHFKRSVCEKHLRVKVIFHLRGVPQILLRASTNLKFREASDSIACICV